MKFTNNLGLPKAVTNLIESTRKAYDKGLADYTPSSLIRPYYLARLEKERYEDLEQDYSNQLNSLEGTILHKLLENAADESDLKETRIYRRFGLWIVGAQFDSCIVKGGLLDDYKYTTSYKFKKNYDGTFPEAEDWEAQLNIGAYILRKGGWYRKLKGWSTNFPHSTEVKATGFEDVPIQMEITKLRIIGFIKDFSLTDADRDVLYPQSPIMIREVPMWNDKKLEDYVIERCQGHEAAAKSPFYEVPQCSEKEMWSQPAKWALMKEGRKTAIKLFMSKEEAEDHARGDGKLFVQERPAKRNRCYIHKNGHSYCPVAKLCQYNKGWENAESA